MAARCSRIDWACGPAAMLGRPLVSKSAGPPKPSGFSVIGVSVALCNPLASKRHSAMTLRHVSGVNECSCLD